MNIYIYVFIRLQDKWTQPERSSSSGNDTLDVLGRKQEILLIRWPKKAEVMQNVLANRRGVLRQTRHEKKKERDEDEQNACLQKRQW